MQYVNIFVKLIKLVNFPLINYHSFSFDKKQFGNDLHMKHYVTWTQIEENKCQYW